MGGFTGGGEGGRPQSPSQKKTREGEEERDRKIRKAGFRLTIRGAHTNVSRGPFLIRVARIFSGGALFPQKVDDLIYYFF